MRANQQSQGTTAPNAEHDGNRCDARAACRWRLGCATGFALLVGVSWLCWRHWDSLTRQEAAARLSAIREAGDPVTLEELAIRDLSVSSEGWIDFEIGAKQILTIEFLP